LLGALAGATAVGLAGCTSDGNGNAGGTDEPDGTDTDVDTTSAPTSTTGSTDTTTAPSEEDTLSGSPPGDGTESPSVPPSPDTETGTTDGVEWAIDVRSRECGTQGNSASVDFDSGAGKVTVSGVIDASNPCRTATVAGVSYDESANTLSVTIGTEAGDQEMCVQCIGEIEYEARFRFPETLPDSVTVTHDGSSGRREVTSADQ
jgi:hypothetical protein